MHTYLLQALPRVVIHRTQVVGGGGEMEKLRVRFSLTKENRMQQTKILTKTDKDSFSPALFRSSLEHKIPVTGCLVCCVCVLFSMATSN